MRSFWLAYDQTCNRGADVSAERIPRDTRCTMAVSSARFYKDARLHSRILRPRDGNQRSRTPTAMCRSQQPNEGALSEVRNPRHASGSLLSSIRTRCTAECPEAWLAIREPRNTGSSRNRCAQSQRVDRDRRTIPVHHTSPTSFSDLSDEEIETLVALLRKAGVQANP